MQTALTRLRLNNIARCSYKIHSEAQNQSRHDIHQIHPKPKQAESEKNYIHQLYQAESATIAGKRRAQKTVAKQFCSITERSDVVHTRVSQHAGRPQDMISHFMRLASHTEGPASHILRRASYILGLKI